MIKGLVSVIIPTYNRADSVVEAINSVKSQSYPLTQIIVVDDGSFDDTARRVAEIEGVEYCHQENLGQGAARNHGLRKADGEYIASLDSDDLWDNDFLARSVECLEKFQLDFVFTNWVKVKGDESHSSEWLRDGKWKPYQTNCQGEWSLLGPLQLRELFLRICPAPSSSLLIKRDSIVTGWGEQMRIADDWYLLLDVVLSRPCRAAFSLTPRWRKRVDGKNVYDGQPFAQTVKTLYLHDYQIFAKDFRSKVTHRERSLLLWRASRYRFGRFLHRTVRADLAARGKRWLRTSLGGPFQRTWKGEPTVDSRVMQENRSETLLPR